MIDFKKQVTSKIYCLEKVAKIELRGTDAKEIFDIISDAMLLCPYYLKGYGFISLGVYLQARVVFNRYRSTLNTKDIVKIQGHSLGGGMAVILGLMIKRHNPKVKIIVRTCGAVKCISKRINKNFFPNSNYEVISIIRYKDPVPSLGWWSYAGNTVFIGPKKKHRLDYDIAEHSKY